MSQDNRPPNDNALWRFSIISPLLHSSDCVQSMREQLIQQSHHRYITADGREIRLCPDTLRNWLSRYRAHGIDGLRDKTRKDRGQSSVPHALADSLVALRKHNPEWTVKRILQHMLDNQLWDGRRPSRSALYRYTAANNLNRRPINTPEPVRSFEFPFFGDLWCSDFLHGPKVRNGAHSHKAYLHAIIDDATRYIVAARFHLQENTRSLLTDMMLATRRFGIPKRFYTDNGSAYRSAHLRMVGGRLGIALPHTPPYRPQGRGKIERFFRSVRDNFLAGRSKTTLEKLNADLAQWITTYHQSPHRSLGCSPLERKLRDRGQQLKQIPPTQDVAHLFCMQARKKVGRDGCVGLLGKRFEIPDALPNTQLDIYYLPWEDDHVLVGKDKTRAREVDTGKNALRFEKPVRKNVNEQETNA